MAQQPTKPVKQDVSPPPVSSARTKARETATFVPYYWEAYCEIVKPERFDTYLIRKWMKDLGPLGFAVVKALRDLCYHNPLTGVLRNECEITMSSLAEELGVGRTTLFREFDNNATLKMFVAREQQFDIRGGKPHQTANLFRVCMDTPIHPDDMDRYDELRTLKEQERMVKAGDITPTGKRIKREGNDPSSYEYQNGTHSSPAPSYESQNGTPETTSLRNQSGTPETTSLSDRNGTAFDYLPSGGVLTKELLTDAASGVSPINPPGDERDSIQESLSCAVWNGVLKRMSTEVNKPTFETHIRTLKLIALDSDAGTAQIEAPSIFTRQWVEGRYRQLLEAAFAAEMGVGIDISFEVCAKGTGKG